jgi:hypothetical protein
MPDLEIRGRGPSFFAELFGTDIGPGKQYRELSKNSFEAIAEYRAAHPEDREFEPTVEAFVDPYTVSQTGANKFAFGDNGIGMSHKTMSELFSIFQSTKTQSLEENYGIGARASTLKFNPEAVEFRSWIDGKGYVCTLAKLREENGIPIYGTIDHEYTDNDGRPVSVLSVVPLEEPYFTEGEIALMKPPFITDHGTVVVLHGKSEGDDTTLMPDDLREELVTDGRSREHTAYWQTHIYNSQYFSIPGEITFRLYTETVGRQDGAPAKTRKNVFHGDRMLRLVKGTKDFLDKFSEKSGIVKIPDATVHWWILGEGDDEVVPRRLNKETGKPMTKADRRKRQRIWFPWLTGTANHAIVSAIHQGEQFDLATKVDAVRMLQKFGIFAGHNNVCIVVEPDPEQGVRSNMNRTSLLVNKRRLPWERWGHEFAQRYPLDAPELLAYIESRLGSTDFDAELDRLLAEMKDDFTVPTAAPRQSRQKITAVEDPNGVRKPHGERVASDPDKPRKPRPEPDPDREIRHRASPNGRRRYKVIDSGKRTMFQNQSEQRPAVKLLSEEQYSYAFRGRAAEYAREASTKYPSGIIYVNRDFDVLNNLIEESLNIYFQTDEARERAVPAVSKVVELVYTAQILFAVMTYRHSFMIGHGSNWSEVDSEKLVSPEALTAIVLARPGMREQIKRRINSKAELKLLMMQDTDVESA